MALLIQFKETPLKRGAWSVDEDDKLMGYINRNGIWNWNEIPRAAGLARTGKSCRLRWMNYLRPNLKHRNFTKEEDETILKLHKKYGNRWATIAAKLPGRSDNEIKNHFNSRLTKIAEKRQLKRHRTSSGPASSPGTSDQNSSVSEKNPPSPPIPSANDPSPTSSHSNYSPSPDTNNCISPRTDQEINICCQAAEEKETGDCYMVDQLQFSVERLCMGENKESDYIGTMFNDDYEVYGLEEGFNQLQGDDHHNIIVEDVDDIFNYFWFDLFNHGC